MMPRSTFFTFARHPELVSGSIAPRDRNVGTKQGGPVLLPNRTAACAEKWTLKQVQGDEGEDER